MRTAKALGGIGALLTAALLGGAMISSVLAESPSTQASPSASPSAPDTTRYCQVFQSKLADELNVSASDLSPAVKAAAQATVDEAVANGDLTQAAAATLKTRIQNAAADSCYGVGMRANALHQGFARGFHAGDLLGAAANALGLQTADLATALRDGSTLKEIAAEKKVDYAKVTKAVLDAAKAELDTAVANGRITQDREDLVLQHLQTALENGDWPRAERFGDGQPFGGQPFGTGQGFGGPGRQGGAGPAMGPRS
jgi:hypothetical protein